MSDYPVEIPWQRNKDGGIISSSQANVLMALKEMSIKLSYDIFAGRPLCQDGNAPPTLLDDAKIDRLWLRLDETFRWRPTHEFFLTVVRDQAYQNSFHPVRDYLDGLKWDGVKRLDNWLTLYGGVEESEYASAVGMLTLVAAVRRVRQPGCKFDEMMVFESKQGRTEKSSAIAALCPDEAWFSDDLPLSIGSKEVIERTAGHWIIECAELDGMRRGDVDKLKASLSRQVDKARLSYDRLPTERPRQFIVIGTTNSNAYLRNSTGNRRFWPVRIGKFDVAALKKDRDKLWAEAAAREAAGQSIRLDESLWDDAAKEQEDRLVVDSWEDYFIEAVGDQTGKILTTSVWDIVDVEPGQQTQVHNLRMGELMQRLGFERVKLSHDGKTKWHYARGTKDERLREIDVTYRLKKF